MRDSVEAARQFLPGGATLEWQCSSPPPHDNFATPPPPVGDPYDFSGLTYDAATDGYVKTE